MTSALVRLLRPHQYIKNGFVLLGLVFSPQRSPKLFVAAAVAFVAFCLAASSIYVLNDIMDLPSDRQHPTKCKRPIASGEISVALASWVSAALALGALAVGAWAGLPAAGFIAVYLLLNLAYSLRYKHVVLVDVFIIASGFMLRILVGTVGIGIAPSRWLLLTGLMLTLFLGFAKRRAELLTLQSAPDRDKASVRRVLGDYSPALLDQLTGITAACAILSYGLYTVDPQTVARHHTYALFYSLPFVIYGVFRYLYLLHHRSGGGDTARDLVTDRHLILTAVLWLGVTMAVLR